MKIPEWIAMAAIGLAPSLMAQSPVHPEAKPAPTAPLHPTPEHGNGEAAAARILYPWKTHITCAVFSIGGPAVGGKHDRRERSAWDPRWMTHFGGSDDPDPEYRIADPKTGDFRPKAFEPKLNPFYVALPYNDLTDAGKPKPDAGHVIPWFARSKPEAGKSTCKDRWVQIYMNGRSCYAQWEECGPSSTDDADYVFSIKPAKLPVEGTAGIAISPAIRDYLEMKDDMKCHWRFVEANQIPYGPWKKYGAPKDDLQSPDVAAQQRYLDYLRKLHAAEPPTPKLSPPSK